MNSDSYWHHLETLLEHSPPNAEQLLSRQCLYQPPSKAFYLRLTQKARPELTRLLGLHLLTSWIDDQHRDIEWREDILQRLAPSLPSAANFNRWIIFPLPVVQGNGSRMIALLLGYSDLPSGLIHAPDLDTGSQEAINDARTAFSVCCPHLPGAILLFPLLAGNRPPLTGRSLGLAFALALYLLHRGLPWPKNFYASGDLYPDGSIHPIDGLAAKQRLLPRKSCLLTALPINFKENGQTSLLGCHDLRHAMDTLEMHLIGTEPSLISRYQHLFVQSDALLHQIHELPSSFFALSGCRDRLTDITNSPERYLGVALGQLQRCSSDPARAEVVAKLYRAEQLRVLVDRQPEMLTEAFAWCIGCLFLANHRGESATDWLELHHDLQQRLSEDEQLIALNHRFVAERFNRYHFSMALPGELSKLVEEEEMRNQVRFRVNRQLGAMYGTLAQNCGFCGPGYLSELDYFIARAAYSFSERYPADIHRLQSYRIYALLDAERFTEVILHLNRYLGLAEDTPPSIWAATASEDLASAAFANQYPLAAALRTLADMGAVGAYRPREQGELPEILIHLPETAAERRHHPWQLIASNLGRLCLQSGNAAAATRLFDHSLAICRENGETMRPMALLACAELHHHGLADSGHYAQAENVLNMLRRSRTINNSHFSPLMEAGDLFFSLKMIQASRARYFPFSYR